jgi:large subunit ribosomal protein L21
MAYAIIKTGGKQYRVEPGDVIRIEALDGEVGSPVTFSDVLLRQTDEGLTLGSPLISGAGVSGKIVAQSKARKVLVYKKKRRKNYRRRHGHRQLVTTVQVLSVD